MAALPTQPLRLCMDNYTSFNQILKKFVPTQKTCIFTNGNKANVSVPEECEQRSVCRSWVHP